MKRFVCLAAIALSVACTKKPASPKGPTFVDDVAPIVYGKCSPCHRPEQAAPFAFLSYEDVKAHAEDVAEVVEERIMPPWRPAAGYGSFDNDRSLTDAQIQTIVTWVKAGSPRGEGDAPAPPEHASTWPLGEPDLIVEMPEAFTVPAEGPDRYRNFALPVALSGARQVAAWSFDPGNAPVVHHAIVNVDREQQLRARSGKDGEPGFEGMDVPSSSPDGFYLVWAPGNQPRAPDPARSWRIDGRTDLVLQLHLQPTGRVEKVRSRIGLYFTPNPPTVRQLTLRIGDVPIDIPPGEASYSIEDTYEVPVDVALLSVFPHAHFLGRSTKSWAVTPDGREVPLLHIPAWDFSWQDKYVYASPVELPAGTTIHMRFTYDNSADNPSNPSRPPVRVRTGERSVDEMGNHTFEVQTKSREDYAKLRAHKYRRSLERQPTARGHYNLGNTFMSANQPELAAKAYADALALDPKLFHAHLNRGTALRALRRFDEAEKNLRLALELQPESAAAMVNLASVLRATQRNAEAIAQLEAAVKIEPTLAAAHNNLGVIAMRSGEGEAALGHFERALASEPDNAHTLKFAAQLSKSLSKTPQAIEYLGRLVQLRPNDVATHNELGVLLAQSGQFERATVHFKTVVQLDPNFAGGKKNLQNVLRAQGLDETAP